MKSARGVIAAVWLLVLAGVAGFALVPSWHLPAFLQKKPQTAQLSKAEQDLAASKVALAAAQAKLDAAEAAKTKAQNEQLAYSQTMVAGIPVALAHAPGGPEVALAASLANRASVGLAAALGGLAPDKQAEIEKIVGEALSQKQAEVDAANAALKVKDAELATATASKKALEGQIPPLLATVEADKAQVGVKDALVASKTAEVAQWAESKAASDAKAGSLGTYASNLFRILIIAGILYLVIHVVLPSVAAEFPAATWLTSVYRTLTSITSAHTVSVPAATTTAVPTTK